MFYRDATLLPGGRGGWWGGNSHLAVHSPFIRSDPQSWMSYIKFDYSCTGWSCHLCFFIFSVCVCVCVVTIPRCLIRTEFQYSISLSPDRWNSQTAVLTLFRSPGNVIDLTRQTFPLVFDSKQWKIDKLALKTRWHAPPALFTTKQCALDCIARLLFMSIKL